MTDVDLEGVDSPFRVPPPKFLYRYTGVTNNLAHLADFVLQGKLWLSSRADFNDPYDCAPVMALPTGELARARLLRNGRKSVRGLQSREAEKEASAELKRLRRMPRRQVERELGRRFSEVADRIGIRCFAEEANDVLMWSHYADFHRGVCLRLNMQLWPSPQTLLLGRVEYSDQRARIGSSGRDDFRLELVLALVRKARGWSYEKEWRVLVHDAARTLLPLPPAIVDGVFIGAKASDETVRSVLKWRQARPDLQFFQMRLSDGTFELISVPAD